MHCLSRRDLRILKMIGMSATFLAFTPPTPPPPVQYRHFNHFDRTYVSTFNEVLIHTRVCLSLCSPADQLQFDRSISHTQQLAKAQSKSCDQSYYSVAVRCGLVPFFCCTPRRLTIFCCSPKDGWTSHFCRYKSSKTTYEATAAFHLNYYHRRPVSS